MDEIDSDKSELIAADVNGVDPMESSLVKVHTELMALSQVINKL